MKLYLKYIILHLVSLLSHQQVDQNVLPLSVYPHVSSCLLACLPARLPACSPAFLLACQPAFLLARPVVHLKLDNWIYIKCAIAELC